MTQSFTLFNKLIADGRQIYALPKRRIRAGKGTVSAASLHRVTPLEH